MAMAGFAPSLLQMLARCALAGLGANLALWWSTRASDTCPNDAFERR